MRTERGKVHEAGEGDGPEVHGVDNIATIELDERELDTWMGERITKRGTDQKTIGQPIAQGENNTLSNIDYVWDDEQLVPIRSRKRPAFCTRELAIIDVGNRFNDELHRGSYGHEQEHCHGVGYESPSDGFPSAIGGVK